MMGRTKADQKVHLMARVIGKLVPRKAGYVKGRPYVKVADLAMVFELYSLTTPKKVDDEMVEKYGLILRSLYYAANRNTERIMGVNLGLLKDNLMATDDEVCLFISNQLGTDGGYKCTASRCRGKNPGKARRVLHHCGRYE